MLFEHYVIRRKIHEELLHLHRPHRVHPDDFPTGAAEWRQRGKEMVLRHSIRIMEQYGQNEQDILRMLQEKFFLSEEEAAEFYNNEIRQRKGEQ